MEDAQRLPLSKLVLTGERHYTRNDDIRQSILALGEPGTFMTQDVNIIQTQIEQRLPWIKQVSVRKQWPDELKIHLVEYVPIARWNDQHMVDAEGNTFSVPPDRTSKQVLPMLYGPEGSANEVLQGYREMGQMLAKDRFTLKEAAMTARRSWQLTLNNDIKLNLGRGDTMKRLARFVELYPVLQQQAQTDGKRISYVDLRYDSGAAVGWAPLPPEESTQQQIRHRQNNNDQGDGQKTGSRLGDWYREGCRFSRGSSARRYGQYHWRGQLPSRGMDKGGVNDLESVVKCVQRAIDQAELMADCQISSVYLALSGKHISCQNEIGMVPISEEEVTQEDVENVVHTAKSVRVRDEHRVLHVIPQEYAIDYQEGIKNPVGLSGVRMQAKVHLITCHNDMAKNIVKAVERCGLKVDQLIFAGLASSYSVLTEDERELGVCVVDIGGGTMDIAVYTGGALRHTKVIPYAGNVVTSDIAYAFGTPPSDAEAIKVRHGCALGSIVGKDESVEVPSVGGRPPRSLQRQTLAEVIEPRYTELLNLVNEEILQLQEKLRQQGVKHHLAAGIVLTGGAAQIEGLAACAQRVFHTQVRIGAPLNITGLTDYAQEPYYSTAVGLLHYGKESHLNGEAEVEKRVTASVGSWIKRLNSWLRKEF
ncbi:cell division protein FtsA [Escherichia coli]|uniref:Multifunctional fusion protein n=54 Tax=cellular organisms TaxID=131567 RepID=A0A376TM27_ECOLX|nr:cell division protein FtsA [Escherichia coli]